MDRKSKIKRSLEILEAKGVSRTLAAPYPYRLAWKLVIALRPPLYAGWFSRFALSGSYFGVAWGVAMYWVDWRLRAMPPAGMALIALLAGVAFGGCTALMMATAKRRHAVPAWREID